MLQGNTIGLRVVCLFLLGCCAIAADETIVPVAACDVLRDVTALDGKTVAVFGRYSYRVNNRWIGEEACPELQGVAPHLTLVEDLQDGPRPPGNFALDNVALHREWVEMSKHTTLGKFRFGTPDYDRWAVIYGRVQKSSEDAKKPAANLIIRGSGVIVFLNPAQPY